MTSTPQSPKRFVPTTALEKACLHCGAMFRGMPSQLANRKYCSQACVGLSRKAVRKKEWVSINCRVCGKTFEVTPGWTRNGRRKYCSRTCSGRSALAGRRLGIRHTDQARQKMSKAMKGRNVGPRANAWRGGRWISQEGYTHVMVSQLPEGQQAIARQMVGEKPYILEHRIALAAYLDRPLTLSEVVHHLDGDKGHNRPENLMLVDRVSHTQTHRMIERKMRWLQARVAELEAENQDLRARVT